MSMKQYKEGTAKAEVPTGTGKDPSEYKTLTISKAAIKDANGVLTTDDVAVSFTINQYNYKLLANIVKTLQPKFEAKEKFNLSVNVRSLGEVRDNFFTGRAYISRASCENNGIVLEDLIKD